MQYLVTVFWITMAIQSTVYKKFKYIQIKFPKSDTDTVTAESIE
jgi:hypothetical protein